MIIHSINLIEKIIQYIFGVKLVKPTILMMFKLNVTTLYNNTF